MEQFVNTLPEGPHPQSAIRCLIRFNHIIHQSDEREAWFAFRQKCHEIYVAEILAEKLWNNEPGNKLKLNADSMPGIV